MPWMCSRLKRLEFSVNLLNTYRDKNYYCGTGTKICVMIHSGVYGGNILASYVSSWAACNMEIVDRARGRMQRTITFQLSGDGFQGWGERRREKRSGAKAGKRVIMEKNFFKEADCVLGTH